ncbi:MAG: DJ-1 family glyoxalase III [Terrimicrobiaceae bacterium]
MAIQKRVLCVVGDGFEEIETVTPIDILRRAGVDVVIASATGGFLLEGRSGIHIQANEVLANQSAFEFDMLLLPGGPGVAALRTDGRAARLAKEFFDQGKFVAAICAAPLLLLDAGILEGTRHTCHSSATAELPEAQITERVVEDGRVITSRGAGTSLEFAFTLVRRLIGPEKSGEIANAIMV